MENISIESFLTRNSTRLAGVGAFAALAGFFSGLKPNIVTYLLSFAMLCGLVLVWSEIDIKTTKEESENLRISSFKFFLRMGFYLIILYILYQYRLMSWLFLFIPIALYLLWLFIKWIREKKWMKEIAHSKKIKNKILTVVIVATIACVCVALAIPLSLGINGVFEGVKWTEQKIEENSNGQDIFQNAFEQWMVAHESASAGK